MKLSASGSDVGIRRWKRAWLLPLAALMVSGWLVPAFFSLGLAPIQVVSLSFLIGMLGGIGWQVWNRRDFVDRFLGWAVAGALAMLVAALPGGEFDGGSAGAGSIPGVVAGVVLAEGWMRQKSRP